MSAVELSVLRISSPRPFSIPSRCRSLLYKVNTAHFSLSCEGVESPAHGLEVAHRVRDIGPHADNIFLEELSFFPTKGLNPLSLVKVL